MDAKNTGVKEIKDASPIYYLGINPLGNPLIFKLCLRYKGTTVFRIINTSETVGGRSASIWARECLPNATDTLTSWVEAVKGQLAWLNLKMAVQTSGAACFKGPTFSNAWVEAIGKS